MTTMLRRSRLLGAVLAGLVIVACSDTREPAGKALANVNAVLQKFSTDGPKYAPDLYASATEQSAAMKADFDKGNYQAVLNVAYKLAPSINTLASTIASKKGEAMVGLDDQWTSMSRDMPKSLSAIEARVADLKKSHKLPKGVSKDALAGASAEVDAAKQGWNDAQSAKTARNLEDAVTRGKAAQAKVSALMASLGMSSGSAAAK